VKLYYYLLSIIAILLNCYLSPVLAAEPPLPAPQASRLPLPVMDFHTISINGPIRVTLEQIKDEGKENFFQINGEQYSPISESVKNDILYLQTTSSTAPTSVTVGFKQLDQLIVDNQASVSANQLTSSGLSIDANNSGIIQLFGMVNLVRLLSTGSGVIQIQWIDSPQLRLDASGASKIQLAGVADSVEMRLQDDSQFQGQYLRIHQIYIQTKDNAQAKLLASDSLRAFAYDNSNIYYYKRPASMTEFTSGSANIIQLNWNK
jgi:hypothetical protein